MVVTGMSAYFGHRYFQNVLFLRYSYHHMAACHLRVGLPLKRGAATRHSLLTPRRRVWEGQAGGRRGVRRGMGQLWRVAAPRSHVCML